MTTKRHSTKGHRQERLVARITKEAKDRLSSLADNFRPLEFGQNADQKIDYYLDSTIAHYNIFRSISSSADMIDYMINFTYHYMIKRRRAPFGVPKNVSDHLFDLEQLAEYHQKKYRAINHEIEKLTDLASVADLAELKQLKLNDFYD